MFASSRSLAAAFTPLREAYGARLVIKRDGDGVRYELDERKVVVVPDGTEAVRVTFLDRATRDAVAGEATLPVYRVSPYPLTAQGAHRLASDLVDFFAGTREPRFRFDGFAAAGYVRA